MIFYFILIFEFNNTPVLSRFVAALHVTLRFVFYIFVKIPFRSEGLQVYLYAGSILTNYQAFLFFTIGAPNVYHYSLPRLLLNK